MTRVSEAVVCSQPAAAFDAVFASAWALI